MGSIFNSVPYDVNNKHSQPASDRRYWGMYGVSKLLSALLTPWTMMTIMMIMKIEKKVIMMMRKRRMMMMVDLDPLVRHVY